MERGSYMLITPGMTVKGVDGAIGNVDEVVVDEGVDIFRGIVVSRGLISPRRALVPADDIVGVTDVEVDVRLTKADFEHLPVEAA